MESIYRVQVFTNQDCLLDALQENPPTELPFPLQKLLKVELGLNKDTPIKQIIEVYNRSVEDKKGTGLGELDVEGEVEDTVKPKEYF